MFLWSALLQVPAPQFKLLMDAFVWGFKHTMRNVAEIGWCPHTYNLVLALTLLCCSQDKIFC